MGVRPTARLPWPVSKYITLRPTVPRSNASAASCASRSSARLMPNPALAASVPAIDWNTRSTGAPFAIASIALVTWVSTQVCDRDGVAPAGTSSSMCSSVVALATLSVAGLMPIDRVADPVAAARPGSRSRRRAGRRSDGWAAAGWQAAPAGRCVVRNAVVDAGTCAPPRPDPGCASAWKRRRPSPASGPARRGSARPRRSRARAASRADRRPSSRRAERRPCASCVSTMSRVTSSVS